MPLNVFGKHDLSCMLVFHYMNVPLHVHYMYII